MVADSNPGSWPLLVCVVKVMVSERQSSLVIRESETLQSLSLDSHFPRLSTLGRTSDLAMRFIFSFMIKYASEDLGCDDRI